MGKKIIAPLLFTIIISILILYSSAATVYSPEAKHDKLSLNHSIAYDLISTSQSLHLIPVMPKQAIALDTNSMPKHVAESTSTTLSTKKSQVLHFKSNQQLIDMAICDLDGDGNDEILTLLGRPGEEYADDLAIYSVQVGTNELLITETYRNTIALIKPWMIATCDLDGDREPEIFIGVNKRTEHYPELENRPFFFNFRDQKLVKKWTGSKLRHPFTTISFADINRDDRDELIVIEQVDAQASVISVYYWFGFGFTLLAESPVYEKIGSVHAVIDDEGWHIEVEAAHPKVLQLYPSQKTTENDIYLLEERFD